MLPLVEIKRFPNKIRRDLNVLTLSLFVEAVVFRYLRKSLQVLHNRIVHQHGSIPMANSRKVILNF